MSDDTNISRLKELALRGKEYREVNEYDYAGETMKLGIGPLVDKKLIPITGALQAKFGMDIEEASEEIEESRDEEGDIDPAKLDEDFVMLMGRAAIEGIDTSMEDAQNADEKELRQVFGLLDEDDEKENIGLVGGMTLEIAQDVMDISDDEDDAEKFRR